MKSTKNLGAILNKEGSCEAEVDHRIGAASKVIIQTWDYQCPLLIHWNTPTLPCQVHDLVQPLYHYPSTYLQHFSSDPIYSWCFPILHSPDACAHFFQTYPLVSIPLYLLLLSTCIYVFILLDSFTLQQRCKVLFPPFPNLYLLTQHLSTFVTYSSHFTATLCPISYLRPKPPLIVLKISLQRLTHFLPFLIFAFLTA